MQPDMIDTIINISDTIGVTAVTIAPANEVT